MNESLSNKKLDVWFFIKKNRLLKNGEAPICMRITVNRQNTEIMIKRSVFPNKWNQKKECATGNEPTVKEINTFIEVNRAKVFKIFRQLEMDGRDISSRAIMDILQGREDPARAKTLIELFTEHNNQARSLIGIDYAEVTVDKFDTSISRLKEYLSHKYKTNDIKFKDVDNEFIRNYDFFLKTERGCHHNSALKHLKNLKKIVRIAMANGWVKNDPFYGIKLIEEETHIEFLTKEELNTLINSNFRISQHEQVRDIFVFCCYTDVA